MTAIQPPFTLYTLRAKPGLMNSPQVPAVHLIQADLDGLPIRTHALTPEQARELAADLNTAAGLPASHGSAFSTDSHTGPAQACPACTMPPVPTVTAEQRDILARRFLAQTVGEDSVAFYEHHGEGDAEWRTSPRWAEAQATADAALSALGIEVTP